MDRSSGETPESSSVFPFGVARENTVFVPLLIILILRARKQSVTRTDSYALLA